MTVGRSSPSSPAPSPERELFRCRCRPPTASMVRPPAVAVKQVPHTPQQAAGEASIQRCMNGRSLSSQNLSTMPRIGFAREIR